MERTTTPTLGSECDSGLGLWWCGIGCQGKWNKIEHRLFHHISMNWKGHPLTSLDVIINLIGHTTSQREEREMGSEKRKEVFILPFISHLSLIAFSLLPLVFSLLPLTSYAIENWPQLETQHFLVIAEPTSQAEPVSLADWDAILGQYIDQLDAAYAPLFGGQTLGPLHPPLGQKPILMICANKASYLKRLGEYAIANPATAGGSGGYYHPDANVILTRRQPTDYYSRHVILHEVAHWYCLQLLGSRYAKMPLWFCEGLADHAAFHTWDGQTLRAVRLPQVTLENYPARLLRLQTSGFRLHEIASTSPSEARSETPESSSPDVYDQYALAWGRVAYLIDEYPKEITRFFELLKQNDMTGSWQSVFDDATQAECSEFADWIAAHQHPWQWVWNHWEDTGTHLIGISDGTALIVQNPARSLKSEVVLLLDRTVIGPAFRYESGDCFEMLQFRNIGTDRAAWRHVRFAQNQWEPLSAWEPISNAAAAVAGAMLEVHRLPSNKGDTLRFFYNGCVVTEQTDASAFPLGLAVQSGAAQFRIVTQ